MADCCSLPNAAELVKELKVCASDCSYLKNSFDLHNGSTMFRAAEAIEALLAENAKLESKIDRLRVERDAAVADLETDKNCDYCKWMDGGDCTDLVHEECHGEHWEWRGVQKEEEDG